MLSTYSFRSLTKLLELLPDLTELVVEREETFEISGITPTGWNFWISSAGNEITVGLAEYHTHFGWHEGDPVEDATEAAKFIDLLRTGYLVLAVWYNDDGRYAGSCPIEATEDPRPKTWLQRWWRRKQYVEIKSWS